MSIMEDLFILLKKYPLNLRGIEDRKETEKDAERKTQHKVFRVSINFLED